MRGCGGGGTNHTHTPHTLSHTLLIPDPGHGTFENKQGNVVKASGITSGFLCSGETRRVCRNSNSKTHNTQVTLEFDFEEQF